MSEIDRRVVFAAFLLGPGVLASFVDLNRGVPE